MSIEGDGSAAGGKGGEQTTPANNELNLASLVERDDSVRLAALPNDRPKEANPVPEKFFLTQEEYFQKLTKLGFEENLGSAQRIRETDPAKIANAIQHGDILRIDNNNKSMYFRVTQDAAGNKWVTSDGKNSDPLNKILQDNPGARIMRSPRKVSV